MDNVSVMVMLFAIVVLGFAARKLGYMSDEFDKRLAGIIVDITCPALILSSVMGDELPDRGLIIPLVAISAMTYILLTIAAVWLPRLLTRDVQVRGVTGFAIMFGNVGFIGYPIVASIFGHKAIFYAAILNIPNTFFVFAVGKSLITGEGFSLRSTARTLICPGLIAAYLSILIVAFGIDGIPQTVSRPISMVGAITVPGSLMIIGSSMARLPLRCMLGNRHVYVTAVLRLAIVPVSMYFFFILMGFPRFVTGINAIIIGMPVASYGTIFCLRYGHDTTFITEVTFITSVASIATIPLLSMLAG